MMMMMTTVTMMLLLLLIKPGVLCVDGSTDTQFTVIPQTPEGLFNCSRVRRHRFIDIHRPRNADLEIGSVSETTRRES